MREIDASLDDNLLSEKVVIIADACHSASIGKGIGRRSSSINSTTAVNRYLENVAKQEVVLHCLLQLNQTRLLLKMKNGEKVMEYLLIIC